MQTFLVDTNVFLRFLTNDVPPQANKAEKRFKDAEKGKINLRILQITVVEIQFALEHWYKLTKKEAVDKLLTLFSPQWMNLDDKDVIFDALENYRIQKIDFVDLLLFSQAKKSKQHILSFDRDYKKLTPMLLKEP